MESTVDLLILGAGWTSTFLIPLCQSRGISSSATSRTGRDDTIAFEFDPHSLDPRPYQVLPNAKTVLITFPIKVQGASERLVKLYQQTHGEGPESPKTAFIQLGSTGIWDRGPTLDSSGHVFGHVWTDRHSKFDEANDRAKAEMELLTLAPKGSIHMIHGLDVSRAVLAVHEHFNRATGERWLLTDLRVYDWWDLASAWGEEGKQPRWVREMMEEGDIKALPRSPETIGRAMESREFWTTFELEPVKGRLGEE
ncbi:hypothetical protein BN946_scf184939.g34 [Trametes cinnabarina]|uniref:Uncharacterized protein n=1 Tax=Pycnoporus cinnabarinus TaxID=5643 RepID=A0A060SBV5_PYCCI|nr:hypothetical protein BN946_scf184939.g34 [Trametes cinnabarina]